MVKEEVIQKSKGRGEGRGRGGPQRGRGGRGNTSWTFHYFRNGHAAIFILQLLAWH